MYTHSPKPVYPLSAQRRGEEGTVIVLVLVTRTGLPENVSVEKTSGHRGLDEAAVAAIKTWRFKPAREGSQAVDSWVRIPVVFRIEGPS
jgi:protein TonB